MPALPILLLKTSNIHNFWFVDPKNTIFFPAKLTARRTFTKVSKILKMVWAQVTLIKTGLSAVRTFGPLGVKLQRNTHYKKELKKTMVRLAKVVLIDRNFYNFFGWN
jgi:hypothetical protein